MFFVWRFHWDVHKFSWFTGLIWGKMRMAFVLPKPINWPNINRTVPMVVPFITQLVVVDAICEVEGDVFQRRFAFLLLLCSRFLFGNAVFSLEVLGHFHKYSCITNNIACIFRGETGVKLTWTGCSRSSHIQNQWSQCIFHSWLLPPKHVWISSHS